MKINKINKILPTVSKVLEKIIVKQLTPFFDKVASLHLSGFRTNHSCKDVLLNFVETVKRPLSSTKHIEL